jgi:hypothetical protein
VGARLRACEAAIHHQYLIDQIFDFWCDWKLLLQNFGRNERAVVDDVHISSLPEMCIKSIYRIRIAGTVVVLIVQRWYKHTCFDFFVTNAVPSADGRFPFEAMGPAALFSACSMGFQMQIFFCGDLGSGFQIYFFERLIYLVGNVMCLSSALQSK